MYTLLKQPAVSQRFGVSRAKLYAWIGDELFVKPVRLGSKSVAWPSHEVNQLIAARIAGKSDEEIRALVAKLESERMGCSGFRRHLV